jgi:DNA-binding NtrC family response regulator
MIATGERLRTQAEPQGSRPEVDVWDTLDVLVVDDEPSICSVLEEALGRWRCRVTACTTGEQAIKEADLHTFDIVFIDVMMPGMNGLQVLQALQRAIPKAVFIMITGSVDSELVGGCLSEGALLSLCKPFSIAGLLELVRDIANDR